MKVRLVICFLVLCFSLSAQKVINVRYPASQADIYLSPGVTIPSVASGYTLWLPKSGSPVGMIVFTHENRDSIQQDQLLKTAMAKKLAVVFLTTDNPLEFLFEEKKTASLAEDLQRICQNFRIPKDKLLYAGHSIGGTRAMKLAIFAKQTEAFRDIAPLAIAIADVPLDMNRFYGKCQEKLAEETKDLAMAGQFSAPEYLANHLDGNPTTSKARFTSYSPYSRTVRNGGNAGYFADMYVRAYVDANINWTSEHHGGNAYDMANFVNQLRLLGSEKAVLIQEDAPRNARTSWDIVDERKLVEWFARKCEN